jgi:hypothetical protein
MNTWREGNLDHYDYERIDLIEKIYHRKKVKTTLYEYFGLKDIVIDNVASYAYINVISDVSFDYTNIDNGITLALYVFAVPQITDNNLVPIYNGLINAKKNLSSTFNAAVILVLEEFKCLSISKRRFLEIFNQSESNKIHVKFINELV